jgi:hypothetical protein
MWAFDVSNPHALSRPVTGIASAFFILMKVPHNFSELQLIYMYMARIVLRKKEEEKAGQEARQTI